MVEKGEIMRYTYKTIGEIPPFSTIFVGKSPILHFLTKSRKKYQKVPKSPQNHQMVGKGEIMRYTYKTIGEISPFSTIPPYPYLWHPL